MANGSATIAVLPLLVLAACGAARGKEEQPLEPVAWRSIVPEVLPQATRARLYAHLSPEDLVTRTVQVVDADGEPVAGADVYYLPGDLDWSLLDEHEDWYAERLGWGTWEFYERYGRRTRTDAEGRAEVTAELGHVVARSGRLYGEMPYTAYVQTWRNLSAEVPSIRLVEETVMGVQVVDSDGQPVPGVGVRVENDGRVRYADNDEAIVTVRIPEIEVGGGLRLSPDVAGYVDSGLTVIPGHAPDPLTLVLPPTGRLVVELRDRDGAGPLRSGWRAYLYASDSSIPATDPPPSWSGRRLPDGRFAFAFVLPGQPYELYVQVYTHHDIEPLARHAIRGPDRPGQEAHVVLQERDDITVVCGRAVDTAGRALSDEWLRLDGTLVSPTPQSERWSYTLTSWTDDGGCFRLVAPEWFHEEKWQAFRLHTYEFSSDPAQYADMRRAPPIGTLQDLGDVVFERAPLLVSGRAVDAEGRPAPVTVGLVRRVDGVTDCEVPPLPTLVGTHFHHYMLPGEGQWEVVVFDPDSRRVVQRMPFEPGTENLVLHVK